MGKAGGITIVTKSKEDTIIVSALIPNCIKTTTFHINPKTAKIARNPMNLNESE